MDNPKQISDADLLAIMRRARAYAKSKRHFSIADDFAQVCALKLWQKGFIILEYVWIDFLRSLYGASRVSKCKKDPNRITTTQRKLNSLHSPLGLEEYLVSTPFHEPWQHLVDQSLLTPREQFILNALMQGALPIDVAEFLECDKSNVSLITKNIAKKLKKCRKDILR